MFDGSKNGHTSFVKLHLIRSRPAKNMSPDKGSNVVEVTSKMVFISGDAIPKHSPCQDAHNALLAALEKETNQLANTGAIAVFEMDKVR